MASKRVRKNKSPRIQTPGSTETKTAAPAAMYSAEAPGTGVFYALAALPAAAFALFVLFFGMFGSVVTAGLDRACAEASFVTGKQMESVGNLEQAVQLYRQALEGRFDDAENRLLCQRSLGEVLWRLDRPGEAIEAFEAVPPHGFERAGSYPAFVNALLQEGELDRSLELGRQWLALAESESDTQQIVWAQFALGQAHERLGQHEAALDAYRVAHELEPGSTASLLVAQTLLTLDRRDEALAHINGVIAALPDGRARRDAEGIRAMIEAASSS